MASTVAVQVMWISLSPSNKFSSQNKIIAQNLHLTATIGLSAVRKQAKKFDMLLTTIRRPRSLMVHQFFLWTSGLRLTVLGASRTALQWQLKTCGLLSVKIRIPLRDHVLSDMVHFTRVYAAPWPGCYILLFIFASNNNLTLLFPTSASGLTL